MFVTLHSFRHNSVWIIPVPSLAPYITTHKELNHALPPSTHNPMHTSRQGRPPSPAAREKGLGDEGASPPGIRPRSRPKPGRDAKSIAFARDARSIRSHAPLEA